MKQKWNQKLLITSLVASVLLGGSAVTLSQSNVFADSATTQAPSSNEFKDHTSTKKAPRVKGENPKEVGKKESLSANGMDRGPGGHGKGNGFSFKGNEQLVASIMGMTKEELKAAWASGKSLSEIAAEKGITEDSLISMLKDGMTEQLKNFVQKKHEPRAEKEKTSSPPSPSPAAAPAANTTGA